MEQIVLKKLDPLENVDYCLASMDILPVKDLQVPNYRTLLLNELYQRKEKNSSYSLRAFASLLGISSGTLSEIVSGKRPLGGRLANRIAERLCLAPRERAALLCNLYVGAEGESKMGNVDANEYQQLEADTFAVIADWYYYAILSLSRVKSSSADPTWISRRLGISKTQAKLAMQRLLKLGLVEITKDSFCQISKPLVASSGVSSVALRKFHSQNLDKAKESLHRDTINERDFSSVTIPIDSEDLVEVKKEITQFRRKLAKKLMKSKTKNRVYTLALQFFPVDNPIIEGERK